MAGDLVVGRGVSPRPTLRRLVQALLAVSLLGAAACSGPAPSTAGTSSIPPPPASACQKLARNAECRSVEVGGRSYRYAVSGGGAPKGAPGSTTAGVLVDFGGPGQSLFGERTFQTFTSMWRGGQTLVALEEPWVTTPVGSDCRRSLAAFYTSAHSGADLQAPAADLSARCHLGTQPWGWTPQLYREVLGKVLTAEGLRLEGVVATSFGAVRASWVWQQPTLQWVILNSPAAPTTDGAAYVAARTTAARSALQAACPGCAVADLDSRVAAATAAWRGKELRAPYRTPTTNLNDLRAALVAAAYLPPGERVSFVRTLGTPLDPDTIAQVGRLSDSLYLRYGRFDMSPAVLAYFSEVCRQYAPWPAGGRQAYDDPFAAMHSVCAQTVETPRTPVHPPLRTVDVCVGRSEQDFVTTRSFAAAWVGLVPTARQVTLPRGQHGDMALTSACVEALASG